MQPKFMKSTTALALVLAGTMHAALAAPIVATPGSLAGYTYFPAATTSSGSGGSGTDNVGTLQRCFWTPTTGDQTVNLKDSNWYDYGDTRPMTFYYKIAGGNGGAGYSAGGGGSSAILKNGAEVIVAPGGDGSATSSAVAKTLEGSFTVVKADSIRFVTGGGGGDPVITTYNAHIGGGGGSGYRAGGGGASSGYLASPTTGTTNAGGKGGGTAPGAGGVIDGFPALAGTAGSGTTGGVATYPDGSSAPVGPAPAPNSGYAYSCIYWMTPPCSGQYRYPATATKNGSSSYLGWTGAASAAAGGGGALGFSGTGVTMMEYGEYVPSGAIVTNHTVPSVYGNYGYGRTVLGTRLELFARPTTLALTRAPNLTGTYQGGGLPGQIVVMYQAPMCSILP